MSYSLHELRAKSDEELIAEHDRHAEHTFVGIQYYLDELTRRESLTIARRTERLTWIITVLTGANVVAAVASLIAVLAG